MSASKTHRRSAIDALARTLAAKACWDAEADGYGWSSDNPEDVRHFLPLATKTAERYVDIVLSALEVAE